MENLHTDILENIFSRLPVEAALYAKRVCPTWRAILRSRTVKPGFLFCRGVQDGDYKVKHQLFYEDEYDHYDDAKMNYYHSYTTLSKMEHGQFITRRKGVVVGSCNGLVCLGKDNKSHLARGAVPFLICNPLTGESVFLPEYNYSELPRDISSPTPLAYSRLASGFGYCPSTNAYKVVTIFYYPGEDIGHIQVYTVGGECRYIGHIIRRYTLEDSSGIHANGALYWLHHSDLRKVEDCEIVAFDLEGEKHCSIPLPRSRNFERPDFRLLGGNNNLYLIHTNYNAAPHIAIWKLNCHHKSSSLWIKEFSITLDVPHKTTPFAITNSNEVLLWRSYTVHMSRTGTKYDKRLYCYDPKTLTLSKLWDGKAGKSTLCGYSEAVPHWQSLVSLKDLGETNVTSLKDSICQETKYSKSEREEILRISIRSRGAKRKKNC